MTVAFDSKTIEQFRLGKATVQKRTLTGTGKEYFSIRPGYHTMITINKDGSTATLKVTNDFIKSGNVDSAIFGLSVSVDTDDFQKGFTPGFTGIEIDVTAYVSDLEIIVSQFLLGD